MRPLCYVTADDVDGGRGRGRGKAEQKRRGAEDTGGHTGAAKRSHCSVRRAVYEAMLYGNIDKWIAHLSFSPIHLYYSFISLHFLVSLPGERAAHFSLATEDCAYVSRRGGSNELRGKNRALRKDSTLAAIFLESGLLFAALPAP